MKTKVIALLLALSLLILAVPALGETSPNARELKYRRLPTASSDLLEGGIVPILEAQGYTLTPVEITDSIQRELALNEGEIDFHVDAHSAYIANVNEAQGTNLTPVQAIPTVPGGVYPGAKSDLADLAEGDKIALPQDASNEARFLYLLEGLGWIKLREGVEPTQYTLEDVVENPLNLELITLSGPTIPAAREDFAFILLRGSDAFNAGIDFKSALAAESKEALIDANYWQITVNSANVEEGWVEDLKAAYRSDEFKEYLKTQSDIWILPDYLE